MVRSYFWLVTVGEYQRRGTIGASSSSSRWRTLVSDIVEEIEWNSCLSTSTHTYQIESWDVFQGSYKKYLSESHRFSPLFTSSVGANVLHVNFNVI